MNSPLLTPCSIFMISVLATVTGQTPVISKCGEVVNIPLTRGYPCYIQCSVTDWMGAQEIGIRKVGVTYYGLDSQPQYKSMDVEYYNSSTGLNPDLPPKYTVERSDNAVNISISAALPEDMGDFVCWTRNGNEVNISEPLTLGVTTSSAGVEQHWERWDASGNVVERFENGEEITIEIEEIESLAFRMNLSEPVPADSVITLMDNTYGTNRRITDAFRQTNVTNVAGNISGVGLLEGFSSTATFSSLDFGLSGISLSSVVTFKGFAIVAFIVLDDVTLHLNVQALPQIQTGQCKNSFVAENGGSLVFNCGYTSNPGSPSFALQLPGREEMIESGDDDKFRFIVSTSGDEDKPYLYNLRLTYLNIADEVFGTNKLYSQIQMGESPSYDFTITIKNAGSKPGLPLLVPVVSSLIAIASFSSRF